MRRFYDSEERIRFKLVLIPLPLIFKSIPEGLTWNSQRDNKFADDDFVGKAEASTSFVAATISIFAIFFPLRWKLHYGNRQYDSIWTGIDSYFSLAIGTSSGLARLASYIYHIIWELQISFGILSRIDTKTAKLSNFCSLLHSFFANSFFGIKIAFSVWRELWQNIWDKWNFSGISAEIIIPRIFGFLSVDTDEMILKMQKGGKT